jgi:hypothetical protein
MSSSGSPRVDDNPPDPITLIVSCKHVSPKYALDRATVTAKPAPGHAGYWYVSIPQFGCSKDYSSPERAVAGMLSDHACTDIFTIRAEPSREETFERLTLLADRINAGTATLAENHEYNDVVLPRWEAFERETTPTTPSPR